MDLVEIITLLTDFGAKDAYVGCIKGVILSIHPQVRVVDISHEIPRFNIRYGAFILMQAAPYFPRETIHVVVVDPGVGTKRHPLVIETERYVFIGPDNGVMTLAAKMDGVKRAFKIDNNKYTLPGPSKTFAGREIFAPVAAHIAKGVPLEEFGPELSSFQVLTIPKPRVKENCIIGEIFIVVSFGNLITNIHSSDIKSELGRRIKVEINRSSFELPFVSAYGDVMKGQSLTLIGSSNFLEIGINQGNASEVFEAKMGDPVCLSRF